MRNLFAFGPFVILIAATIPYMIDIVKGRARPARSARIMLLLLIIVTLFQQKGLGTGGALSLTVPETVISVKLVGLAIKY